MSIKYIIFDFDGVIADSFSKFLDVYGKIHDEYNFPDLSPKEILELRNLTAGEIFKKFNISKFLLLKLFWRYRMEMRGKFSDVKIFPGIKNVVASLHAQNYHLGIVSHTSEKNIREVLKANNLEYFDFVESMNPLTVYFYQKAQALRSILKKYHLTTDEVIYIGDQTTDIEESHKAGIKIISVGWGYQTKTALLKDHPDYFTATPKELLKVIKEVSTLSRYP